MYRDDLEALQAQVRTLQAELEAQSKGRTAAEAGRRAAEAAADEARLAAKRAGEPPVGFWRRYGVGLVGFLAAAVAVGVLFYRHSLHERHLEAARRVTAQVRNEADSQYAELEKRCRRPHSYVRPAPVYSQQGGSAAGTATGQGKETLSRAEIQQGMRMVKGSVQDCYERYKIPGMVNVQVKIQPHGGVTRVRVKGMFSGTPTGSCVTTAMRSARFPRFYGSAITITYPYILR